MREYGGYGRALVASAGVEVRWSVGESDFASQMAMLGEPEVLDCVLRSKACGGYWGRGRALPSQKSLVRILLT